MALPKAPEEKAYGAVQEEEALEAAAPPPIEESPAEADAASQEAVVEAAQQVMPEQQAPSQAQGYTVKNPYMLLPPRMNLGQYANGQRTKTPVERQYDVGLLWDVLASDAQAPELTRMVARKLMEVKK